MTVSLSTAPRCTISGTFPFNHDELRHVASLHKLSPGLVFPLQSMSLLSLINTPLLWLYTPYPTLTTIKACPCMCTGWSSNLPCPKFRNVIWIRSSLLIVKEFIHWHSFPSPHVWFVHWLSSSSGCVRADTVGSTNCLPLIEGGPYFPFSPGKAKLRKYSLYFPTTGWGVGMLSVLWSLVSRTHLTFLFSG